MPVASALHLAKEFLKSLTYKAMDHYLLVLCYNGINLKKQNSLTQQLLNILPQMTEKGQLDVLGVFGEYYQQRNPKRFGVTYD